MNRETPTRSSSSAPDQPDTPGMHLLAQHGQIRPDAHRLMDEPCTLGRDASSTIVLPFDLVSRAHAVIIPTGTSYVLRDTQSHNGTFVNGMRLSTGQEHTLSHADAIGLGRADPLLLVHDPQATAEGLRLHTAQQRFTLNHQPIDLAPQEYRLLRYLYEQSCISPHLCSREDCAKAMGLEVESPNGHISANSEVFITLQRVVSSVRTKLKVHDPNEEFVRIENRHNYGYTLF